MWPWSHRMDIQTGSIRDGKLDAKAMRRHTHYTRLRCPLTAREAATNSGRYKKSTISPAGTQYLVHVKRALKAVGLEDGPRYLRVADIHLMNAAVVPRLVWTGV